MTFYKGLLLWILGGCKQSNLSNLAQTLQHTSQKKANRFEVCNSISKNLAQLSKIWKILYFLFLWKDLPTIYECSIWKGMFLIYFAMPFYLKLWINWTYPPPPKVKIIQQVIYWSALSISWHMSNKGKVPVIICTQPRRISAIGVAERVAQERDEKAGNLIGYQIRLESKTSSMTRLLFCTTGILVSNQNYS